MANETANAQPAGAHPRAHLTRRYWFAASHRLHNDVLDAEENRRIYGKCNNPYGHGHNYALEVTVGAPTPAWWPTWWTSTG